ncbi:MAG: glutathione-dependent formaldehyde dehydrogenase [Nitrospirae bacterium]|nr:glutathione-dependent formaldehyde dehydrogenase [Candidatus Manganitrophaceae bacterium]
MKAVVFHNVGDIRLEEVPDPRIEKPNDAVVRIIASAICGTDLHMIRGTLPGMKPGTILGHEGVGIIEALGPDVRNFNIGDRVIIPSTICCGYCTYCRVGYTAQCDNANPNGPTAGTAFYGGPAETGPFNGLQAEKARIPFAASSLILAPDGLTDDEAILLSDIFPTGYFGAELAEILPGDTVAVFGCGPVGQFVIASAKLLDAGLVFAIDTIPSRLEMARAQGAMTIDYNQEDPIEAIRRLTGGIGVDRAIDAVGVDASQPNQGPASEQFKQMEKQFQQEVQQIAPQTQPQGDNWHPGDAPSAVSQWAVEVVAKAGTVSIIGVYPPTDRFFPIGKAMNKNLTINMGNCNHRTYIPKLIDLILTGVIDPTQVLTQHEPLDSVLDAYKAFDKREPGWVKVMLEPVGTME